MTIDIVKVQVPFTKRDNHILVHDRDRQWISRQEPTPTVIQALNGDMTGYFRAEWMGFLDGWLIGRRVPDEDW